MDGCVCMVQTCTHTHTHMYTHTHTHTHKHTHNTHTTHTQTHTQHTHTTQTHTNTHAHTYRQFCPSYLHMNGTLTTCMSDSVLSCTCGPQAVYYSMREATFIFLWGPLIFPLLKYLGIITIMNRCSANS